MVHLPTWAQTPDEGTHVPEDIVGTWYMYAYHWDIGPMIYISELDPPIQPTLVIDEQLRFSGIASCNTYSGIFVHDPDGFENITPINFEHSEDPCDNHFDFEELYFLHYDQERAYDYYTSVDPDNGNLLFTWTLPTGGNTYFFQNEPVLDVTDSELEKVEIFPNPATEKLFLSTAVPIENLRVLDLNGKQLKLLPSDTREVSVASLPNGLYFLELKFKGSLKLLRFIKN